MSVNRCTPIRRLCLSLLPLVALVAACGSGEEISTGTDQGEPTTTSPTGATGDADASAPSGNGSSTTTAPDPEATEPGDATDPGGDTDGSAAAADASIDAEAVAAARAQLGDVLASDLSPDDPCPLVSQELFEQAAGQAGLPVTLGGYGWERDDLTEIELAGLLCGGDSDGDPNDAAIGTALNVIAYDLDGRVGFDDLLDLFRSEIGAMTPSVTGDDASIAAGCGPVDDLDLCVAVWSRDDLVLTVSGAGDGLSDELTAAILVELVPEVVGNLAAP